MRCLGMQCTAILVGTMMSYGLLWGIYIKVACGLRRSLYYWQRVIIALSFPPMVQPTCVQHGIPTSILFSTTPAASHLQPMQVIISTCPPWVSTNMVSCTMLATTACIGRQVLTQGTISPNPSCPSTVFTSPWEAKAASTVTGSSQRSSSPRACPLQVSPSKKSLPEPTVTDRREVKGREFLMG